MLTGDRRRHQTERALPPSPDDLRAAVRDAAPWWRARGGLAALGRARRGARPRPGRARADALLSRRRRRHDRVLRSLPQRPPARPVAPAPARPAPAANADCGACPPASRLRAADRGEARTGDRARDRSSLRRAGADARGDRLAFRRNSAGSAWRPGAPRRSFASAARSISRACAPSRSRRSRRGCSASAAWGRGRSGSSRSKGSAAGATGSSAISAWSSSARPSAAGGSSCTRPPSCWSHTANGRGSRARI